MFVYLKDNLTQELFKIGLNDAYEFTADESDDQNRFELIFVKSTTSVNDINDLNVNLYPNPNNGFFNLSILKNDTEFTVNISDVTGKTVYLNRFNDDQVHEINIKDQTSGIYFVKISLDNGIMINKKIIIK